MSNPKLSAEDVFRGEFSSGKYHSSNPIARYLVTNFLATLMEVVRSTGAKEAHEIGCGEGQISGLLAREGIRVRGCDASDEALRVAAKEAARAGLRIPFERKDIYQLTSGDEAELVLCCEVLEHLTNPDLAVQNLIRIARAHLILSVPREPIWHILNMARGKYLTALGNTPGHYNHWSTRQFVDFVSRYADVVEVRSPLPWTIVHCRLRSQSS